MGLWCTCRVGVHCASTKGGFESVSIDGKQCFCRLIGLSGCHLFGTIGVNDLILYWGVFDWSRIRPFCCFDADCRYAAWSKQRDLTWLGIRGLGRITSNLCRDCNCSWRFVTRLDQHVGVAWRFWSNLGHPSHWLFICLSPRDCGVDRHTRDTCPTGAPGAAGDFSGSVLLVFYFQEIATALHDTLKGGMVVIVEA